MGEVISCAPGAHIGELKALGFLKEKLGNSSYLILTNYHLPDVHGTLEIDLVFINYHGVFLLEVKDWWGKIVADPVHWENKGHKRHSPVVSIENKAKVAHSVLAEAGLGGVSVVGLVVLAKGTGALITDDEHTKRKVFGLNDDLIHALTSDEYLFSPNATRLPSSMLEKVKHSFLKKKVDPEQNLVGQYRLVAEMPGGETYDAFEAVHLTISQRRVRLKRYHIPAIKSMQHLQESVRRFKQDMEALSYVEGHTNIVRAYDFFKDPDTDDTYYLALEYIDGKTLRDILDENQEISLQQQMRYLMPVADALDYCHTQTRPIIHRNLTPNSIYATEDGTIKLGDFDFAKVPAIGDTISKAGEPLVENKYVAPEQITDARNVEPPADIYSLGAVWYDLALRRPKDEPIRMALIEDADLPEDAKDLMRQMLAPHPESRLEWAAYVSEWFELLASI